MREQQRQRQRQHRHKKTRSPGQEGGAGPRRLGRLLLGLVLLGLTAAVLFAMLFMPGQERSGGEQKGSVVVPEEGGGPDGKPGASGAAGKSGASGDTEGGKGSSGRKKGSEKGLGEAGGASSSKAPKGYKMSRDPAGFEIAVPQKWDRRAANGRGQVRYNGGEVEMVLANGRDTTKKFGKDPMAYQSEHEPELAAYRAADWASTGGLRRIDVGSTAMAEGTFTWREQGGREVYARNRAMILDGRYHVLLVIGSESRKREIDRHFEAVADTYRAARR